MTLSVPPHARHTVLSAAHSSHPIELTLPPLALLSAPDPRNAPLDRHLAACMPQQRTIVSPLTPEKKTHHIRAKVDRAIKLTPLCLPLDHHESSLMSTLRLRHPGGVDRAIPVVYTPRLLI